ncbi:DNA mismatch repair endonuclease MutL [Zeaxanthinibacter sp. PT1]|uniref:DNA mismatch repair endonuclease MutL n=1 Tax=Zeaxanthinibacter TaxID=561554 RepID=UPI0023493AD4|nr:DNA mismatch repair endonuclease MutL [Zeaxanthinibacter sp. PT1]MDC6352172.1 DNA mismatch repair endonuclease MutL [Zeaxanthinibacter sp. PT1]
MPDRIQLLPDHVANQIAAGEVVQRPASVVKELLENAIDAGAENIQLIIKDGGKTLIQVVDDGMGMSVTDARLSFERHATSKIRNADDLFHLNTKGFRGEALASIAAIAHVEMKTRPGSDELGTLLSIQGSRITDQEVITTPVGTSVAVKNLFFNIPARRNFLKSKQVELRHITDEFHRVALAHPGISFQYFHDGNELFNLPDTNHRQRIVHLFGGKTNEKLVPVTEETQVVEISGFICKPEFAKKSRGEQFFFVNDRFIKSPYLHHAVSAAFEGLIRSDVHPGYFLFLKVDPGSIDINIHPTKTEIKFDDEQTLYAILRSSVKHSLGQFNIAPVLDFERDQNLDTPYDFKEKGAHPPRVSVDAGFNPFKEEHNKRSAPTQFSSRQESSWESMYVGLDSQVGSEDTLSVLPVESDSYTSSIFDSDGEKEQRGNSFQLRRKYIVTTIKSGMLVIDQSRAHQRVLYEKFLKSITIKNAVSQQLLFPMVLHFSPSEMNMIREIRESLVAIGFAFGTLGEEQLQVTGVPLMVNSSEVGMVLDHLISDYQSEQEAESFSQTDILSKTLCKSLAVKSGEILDAESRMALVDDLFACKEPALSPFGKKTYITLTESDIDKKFI